MTDANSTIRLSPEGRNALRRAITNHPRWDETRKANNYSLATMSRDDYFAVANILRLDVRSIVDTANALAPANPKAEKARDVFSQQVRETTPNELVQRIVEKSRPLPEGLSVSDEAPTMTINIDPEAAEMARRAQTRHETNTRVNGHAHPAPDGDKAGQLMRLISELAGNSVDPEQVKAIVQDEIAKALLTVVPTVRIELTREGVSTKTLEGHQHPNFGKLLRYATARDKSGYVPNIWLAGPAGSGKTHAANQIAEALDLAFHYNGAIGMAYELLGFTDANGCYHRTPFREAYENGGVYLFDEVDGSDNAALLALNAALANGTATFPDGQVTRHKDCIIIAAANTWGFGGTADYVGRSKLDAAFLSRFPVRIQWNYDEQLERNICGNAQFAERVQAARANAKSAGLKVLITPRDSIAGAALIAAGATPSEAAQDTYLANLSPEQRRMIEA